MTRVDEFDSFYRSTSPRALCVVYAVTGDRSVAADVTVDAYRRAWRDWSKIRDGDAVRYVRSEAWKLAVLSKGTHPLRRRHEDDSDTELLDALASLPADDRRLIVLMTLGGSDLDDAAREVGVTDEEGIEKATTAIAVLEEATGRPLEDIERRLYALGEITDQLSVPSPEEIRRRAVRGRRRNTVALVLGAVLTVVGAGIATTEGDLLAASHDVPDRQRFGAERPDVVLDSQKIGTDNLLTARQVSTLDRDARWSVSGTDTSTDGDTPYATCPPERFATTNPVRAFVRDFTATGPAQERVAQAIEVAPGIAEADAAYAQLVSWYADCAHPRVQLVESYRVQRPFGDFLILRLVSHRSPQRTFTVGLSKSGTVTSTLVHEVDSLEAPSVETFAQTLNDSIARVCADSGGRCSDDVSVEAADPPPTSEASAFLGIVDLPPIASIDSVWAGVEPTPNGTNPAATACDRTTFDAEGMTSVASRIFVIPEAADLPTQFGVVETIGRLPSVEAATAFTAGVRDRIAGCAQENLGATIEDTGAFDLGNDLRGQTWRLTFEVAGEAPLTVRTAIVQRGPAVAQVTFTPAGEADVPPEVYLQLAQRAAQRLVYLP